MKKYKIGEASKILGLTNDTLRYYESKGIITPQRDSESGYRYYDSWDLNFLLDSMWLRSYGFSVLDITDMINNLDLDKIIENCHKQEINLVRIIDEYQQKLKYLAEYSHNLKQIDKKLGLFSETESPTFLFKERVSICEGDETEIVLDSESINWTKLIPMVENSFIASLNHKADEITLYNLCWGFSLPLEVALQQKLDKSSKVEYIPSLKSIHTVFYANDKGSFEECFLNQVILPIKEQGHKMIKSPIGRLLIKVHRDGELIRYFETWVPVE